MPGWTGVRNLLYKRPSPGAQVAQLVEQRTENPCVGGSIPPLGTIILYPVEIVVFLDILTLSLGKWIGQLATRYKVSGRAPTWSLSGRLDITPGSFHGMPARHSGRTRSGSGCGPRAIPRRSGSKNSKMSISRPGCDGLAEPGHMLSSQTSSPGPSILR
jgi:hypothetical protein